MPHIIWKGAISFGLVHVPVQLFPATQQGHVGFHLLDRRTSDPIGYRQINKRTGKEVPREHVARGFEYEKDSYVLLSDEEIRAASPESTQTVDILAFVDAPEIPFLYLDTPYYLAPERKGEKVYALLREALRESGKIGVASVVLHNRQHLAALVPVGPVLALDTLRWAAEVRDWDELKLPPESAKEAGVSARELTMAKKLIEDMSDHWDPQAYRDTFRDEILELIDRKLRAGKTSKVGPVEETTKARRSADILDLSELLKRSLGRGRKASSPSRDSEEEGESEGNSGKRGSEPKTAPRRKSRSGTTRRRSAA